jgi:hypothetical protein
MITIQGNIALKEWASVCSALAAGDQILLLRKGGIHERTFKTPPDEFLLFPTFLHQKERQFKPRSVRHLEATRDHSEEDPTVSISTWCRVAATFEIADLEKLLELEPFVIFSDETIRERYAFRPDQAVKVMVVRAMRLPKPVEVVNQKSYAGCRSWITIGETIALDGSEPVLSEDDFRIRLQAIESIAGAAVTPAV